MKRLIPIKRWPCLFVIRYSQLPHSSVDFGKWTMDKKFELCEVILGDLLAETLEREASLLPPDHRLHAVILRRQAEYFRFLHMRNLWVWREVPKDGADTATPHIC